MDIRTISGAGYSRPVASIAGGDIAPPVESAKSTDASVPFISPVYRFDPVARLSILAFRDTSTGTVTQQFPSVKVVEQYRRTRGDDPSAKPVAATPAPAEPAAPTPDTAKLTGQTGAGPSANAAAPAPETTASASPPVSAAPEKAAPAPVAADVQRVSMSV